jgi:hypothetical protein
MKRALPEGMQECRIWKWESRVNRGYGTRRYDWIVVTVSSRLL